MYIEIPAEIRSLMQRLIDNNHKAYIIGGAVRDSIMQVKPKDWDIFTDASGDEILKIFEDKHPKIMGGEERQEKILTVIIDGTEISQFRKNGDRTEVGHSLEEHLSTCDLSINAIALDANYNIIDPHNGIEDIQAKIIRAVGDPSKRIAEDKLRAMRAVRFASRFGFRIDLDLIVAIKETDVTTLPVERTTEELLKILRYKGGVEKLLYVGILYQLIPEMRALEIDGGGAHAETVIEHSTMAADNAIKITDKVLFIFGCLEHDIGKGATMELTERGRIAFHNHENVGADMLATIMERMKFSTKDIKYVVCLVRNHMMHYNDPGKKALKKVFAECEANGVNIHDLSMMCWCDSQANLSQPRIRFGDFLDNDKILEEYHRMKFSRDPLTVRDLEINGRDVMAMGISEGPQIGRILLQLFEEVNEGNILNERSVLMVKLKEIICQQPK